MEQTELTDPVDGAITAALASLPPTDARLEDLVENAKPVLEAKDPSFELVRDTRLELWRARTGIERRRKSLVEGAVRYQKAVNDEAKRLKEIVEPTENLLYALETSIKEAQKAEERRLAALEEERLKGIQAQFAEVGCQVAILVLKSMSPDEIAYELAAAKARHEEAQRVEAEREAERAAQRAELARVKAEAEAERKRAEEERRELARRLRIAEEAEEAAKREAERLRAPAPVVELTRANVETAANAVAAAGGDPELVADLRAVAQMMPAIPAISHAAFLDDLLVIEASLDHAEATLCTGNGTAVLEKCRALVVAAREEVAS